VTLTLTFTSQNGFQGQVSLSVLEGGQPVSWLSPNAVQRNLNVPRGQQVQETLEVQVAPNAPTGSRNLTVRAAYGNQVTERALTLTVSEPGGGGSPNFTISLSPDSLTVQQGASGTTQLTITPQNGFTGTVSLALVAGQDQVPQGLTLSPDTVQVGTSSLTLSAQPTTPTGTYRLKVRGTSGSLTREADLTLTVSGPGTTWTRRTSGTIESLYGVTYSGDRGLFVAVGTNGTILTSPNGVSWARQTSETVYALQGVTYGDGKFVVVGSAGTILTSPEGVSWALGSSGTPESLYGVTYENRTFVAVGGGGTIRTSPDGVAWMGRSSGTRNWIYDVTYGNGKFVAVEGGDAFLISLDNGFNWTRRTAGIAPPPGYSYVGLGGVTYGNGKFVAVGNRATILTSPDGETWTQRDSGASTINNLFSVTYGNGTFVAVGYPGTILTSPDGETWTQRTSGTTEGLYGVAYGNGTFVAVGEGGTILTSP